MVVTSAPRTKAYAPRPRIQPVRTGRLLRQAKTVRAAEPAQPRPPAVADRQQRSAGVAAVPELRRGNQQQRRDHDQDQKSRELRVAEGRQVVQPAEGGQPTQPGPSVGAVRHRAEQEGHGHDRCRESCRAPANVEDLRGHGRDSRERGREAGQTETEQGRSDELRPGAQERGRDRGACDQGTGNHDQQREHGQVPSPGGADEEQLGPSILLLAAKQPGHDEHGPDPEDELEHPAAVPDREAAGGVETARHALEHARRRVVREDRELLGADAVRVRPVEAGDLEQHVPTCCGGQQQGAPPHHPDRPADHGSSGPCCSPGRERRRRAR